MKPVVTVLDSVLLAVNETVFCLLLIVLGLLPGIAQLNNLFFFGVRCVARAFETLVGPEKALQNFIILALSVRVSSAGMWKAYGGFREHVYDGALGCYRRAGWLGGASATNGNGTRWSTDRGAVQSSASRVA